MSSRTKDRIAEKLFALLQEKPFDKITVKELVETCDVTRQTFYYHFQDLFDVLEWSLQGQMARVGASCMEEEDPIKALKIFVLNAFESSEAIIKLFESQHRGAIEQMMVEIVREYLRVVSVHDTKAVRIAEEDMEVALDFYTYAIVGTLLSASMRGEKDADRLAQQLYRLIYGSLTK